MNPPEHSDAIFELSQRFYFEAAHTLERAIDAPGSKRIHGHTYEAEITLSGVPDAKSGMLVDLGWVRAEIAKVRARLDHHFLDEVQGLEKATLEGLCAFIRGELQPLLPTLTAVAVERRASGDKCVMRFAAG